MKCTVYIVFFLYSNCTNILNYDIYIFHLFCHNFSKRFSGQREEHFSVLKVTEPCSIGRRTYTGNMDMICMLPNKKIGCWVYSFNFIESNYDKYYSLRFHKIIINPECPWFNLKSKTIASIRDFVLYTFCKLCYDKHCHTHT